MPHKAATSSIQPFTFSRQSYHPRETPSIIWRADEHMGISLAWNMIRYWSGGFKDEVTLVRPQQNQSMEGMHLRKHFSVLTYTLLTRLHRCLKQSMSVVFSKSATSPTVCSTEHRNGPTSSELSQLLPLGSWAGPLPVQGAFSSLTLNTSCLRVLAYACSLLMAMQSHCKSLSLQINIIAFSWNPSLVII